MPEIFSIHLGHAGVQIGEKCWELYCMEHGIKPDGTTEPNFIPSGDAVNNFFCERDGERRARAIFVDLEPTATDKVKTGTYKRLFPDDCIIGDGFDSGNLFARGKITVGKKVIDLVMDRIRLQTEKASELQGFLIYRSYGGGTGSGLTALLMEYLSEEYGRKTKLDFSIVPGPQLSMAVTEPYNAVLTASNTIKQSQVAFLLGNEALYETCRDTLNVEMPQYADLNRLVGQIVSSITLPLRFEGSLNVRMDELQNNLVALPRLHFPVTSYAPIFATDKVDPDQTSTSAITSACFERANQMVRCGDLDTNKYMGLNVMYRGDVVPSDVNAAIEEVQRQRSIQFMDGAPTRIQTGIVSQPPSLPPGGELAQSERAVCMLSNTTAIADTWKRLTHNFDLLYNKKAFVHWYTQYEGMEEGEFTEARETLANLEKEYEEVKNDCAGGH